MTESMATLELSLLLLVAACPGGVDSDFDGLSDSCELEVATQFAPIFVVSPSACNWDASAERLGGAYLFGVSPIPDGLRISYLPAYLDDCGWAGPKCLLRWRGGCDPHAGDSEFIALDLATDTLRGGWRVDRVFLSAHCFGRGDDDCRWYSPGELQWLDGAPFVWVAEGKNANYPSRSACDRGHWHFDTCDRNDRSVRFPVMSLAQDIGAADAPFPHHPRDPSCVVTAEVPLLPTLTGVECIWTDADFHGWHDSTVPGSTGYRRYLTEIAQFAPLG